VQVGDPVIAIGAPYGLDGTVTTGIVSAKDRPVSAGGGTGKDVSYISALQTDAAINPGNSGGPLINAAGQVVGVNSAIRSAAGAAGPGDGTTEEGAGSIGLGFSIPVNQARRIAGELIEHGRAAHPVIGVAVDMAYRGGGARLSEQTAEGQGPVVRPGGPADKAGLKPGEVVVSMDGRRIVDGKDLIVSIRARVPGDRVKLVVRDAGGAERTVELVLEGEGGKG
jgi:putative serine protease PepD